MPLPYRLDLHRTLDREAHVAEVCARIRTSASLPLADLETLASDPDERIFETLCFSRDFDSRQSITPWLFAKASERADAEGLLWTPLLELTARLREMREGAPADVETRRQALTPWIAGVEDWALLEPLWLLNSEPWRKFIAANATLLPEKALAESSPAVRAEALKNPSLAPSTRHAAAHLLLRPSVDPYFSMALEMAMRRGFEPTATEWESIDRAVAIAVGDKRLPRISLILARLRPEAPPMSREIFDKLARVLYSESRQDDTLLEAMATHPLASSLVWGMAAHAAALGEQHRLWTVLFSNPLAAQEPEVIATAIDSLNSGDMSLLPGVAPHLSSVDFWAWMRKVVSSHPDTAAAALASAPPATLRAATLEDMDACVQSSSAALRTAAILASGATPLPKAARTIR